MTTWGTSGELVYTEEWRTVPGYDGYEVSNLGGFRSWKRQGTGGGFAEEPPTGKGTRTQSQQTRKLLSL